MRVAITRTSLFSLDFLFSIAAGYSLPGALISLDSAISRTHVLCTGCVLISFPSLTLIPQRDYMIKNTPQGPNDKSLNHLGEQFDPSTLNPSPAIKSLMICKQNFLPLSGSIIQGLITGPNNLWLSAQEQLTHFTTLAEANHQYIIAFASHLRQFFDRDTNNSIETWDRLSKVNWHLHAKVDKAAKNIPVLQAETLLHLLMR